MRYWLGFHLPHHYCDVITTTTHSKGLDAYHIDVIVFVMVGNLRHFSWD